MSLLTTDRFTMAELCESFGISRKTGYKWKGRYEAQGMAALEEWSRAPRTVRVQRNGVSVWVSVHIFDTLISIHRSLQESCQSFRHILFDRLRPDAPYLLADVGRAAHGEAFRQPDLRNGRAPVRAGSGRPSSDRSREWPPVPSHPAPAPGPSRRGMEATAGSSVESPLAPLPVRP
ncbi:MAG: helix-turn-helix domain-containing protein [Chthoniobacterales bacterium]|nr:helix-turn-helix domain-containing protein [Chthoniobacterales bacterium]